MTKDNLFKDGLFKIYVERTEDLGFHFDEKQIKLVKELDHFANKLNYQESLKARESFLGKIFSKKNENDTILRGFYIHGGVGTGKTMLMDLLYKNVKVSAKKRFHFHEFMRDVHNSIKSAREKKIQNPIELVADTIFNDLSLICFDEMQISDIADAMLVGRLFEKIVAKNISFVCTSNRKPIDLYKDGLNRQLFIPFIKILEDNLKIYTLETGKDYRKDLLKGKKKYFTSSAVVLNESFQATWTRMTLGEEASPFEIKVGTREILIPNFVNGIGKFNFKDLCERPLSSIDYLSILQEMKVIFLEGVPIFSEQNLDTCRRFISLIDVIYESEVLFICHAEEVPELLYQSKRSLFEFERTISRLEEMRSADWPKVKRQ